MPTQEQINNLKDLADLKQKKSMADSLGKIANTLESTQELKVLMVKGEQGLPGAQGDKGDPGEKGATGEQGPQGQPGQDGKDGADGLNGIDGLDGNDGEQGVAGNDAEVDIESIVNQVLEKLPKSTTQPNGIVQRIVGGGRPRVFTYDLSSQCDGVTKAFKMPMNFGVLGVFSTEFPLIYRPAIDYTAANSTLTLTSQVSAPQAGQTLIVQYVR